MSEEEPMRRRKSDKEPSTPIPGTKSVADELRISLRRLAIATVLLYIVIAGLALKIYEDGQNTSKALCSYREDLIQRTVASFQFLKDHPQGIPNVPTKTLLDSLSNQQRAIIALRDLNCSTDSSAALKPLPTAEP